MLEYYSYQSVKLSTFHQFFFKCHFLAPRTSQGYHTIVSLLSPLVWKDLRLFFSFFAMFWQFFCISTPWIYFYSSLSHCFRLSHLSYIPEVGFPASGFILVKFIPEFKVRLSAKYSLFIIISSCIIFQIHLQPLVPLHITVQSYWASSSPSSISCCFILLCH